MACHAPKCDRDDCDLISQSTCLRYMSVDRYKEYHSIERDSMIPARLINKNKSIDILLDTVNQSWEGCGNGKDILP